MRVDIVAGFGALSFTLVHCIATHPRQAHLLALRQQKAARGGKKGVATLYYHGIGRRKGSKMAMLMLEISAELYRNRLFLPLE
jgi:hypothetical protein